MRQSGLSTRSFGCPDANRRQRRAGLVTEARTTMLELARDFATPGSILYQLGLSENDLLSSLHASLEASVDFVGTCVSEEHLERCRDGLEAISHERRIELVSADLNRGISVRDASVVVIRERQRCAPTGAPLDFSQSNDDLLVASSLNEEYELLSLGGFRSVEVFFKWYGLCGLIAIK